MRKTLGWSVEFVERPKKLVAEEVLVRWAAEWQREGVAVDWRKVLPPKGYKGYVGCCLGVGWCNGRFLGSSSKGG